MFLSSVIFVCVSSMTILFGLSEGKLKISQLECEIQGGVYCKGANECVVIFEEKATEFLEAKYMCEARNGILPHFNFDNTPAIVKCLGDKFQFPTTVFVRPSVRGHNCAGIAFPSSEPDDFGLSEECKDPLGATVICFVE